MHQTLQTTLSDLVTSCSEDCILCACVVQGKTSQVACKKEMLLREDVAFETEDTVSATSVIPCADLAKLYNLHALSSKHPEDC